MLRLMTTYHISYVSCVLLVHVIKVIRRTFSAIRLHLRNLILDSCRNLIIPCQPPPCKPHLSSLSRPNSDGPDNNLSRRSLPDILTIRILTALLSYSMFHGVSTRLLQPQAIRLLRTLRPTASSSGEMGSGEPCFVFRTYNPRK